MEPLVLEVCRKWQFQRVLDVGTGNGSLIPSWIAQGWSVSAMEPDEEGFRIASRYSSADIRQIGVGDQMPPEWRNAFDAVISLEVVEHLFNPHQLVSAIEVALKPGGIAIISTPYHGYIKNLMLSFMGKWDFHHHPERTGGHIKFFSIKTLDNIFKNKSFELIEFRGAGRVPFLWKSMVVVFKKCLI